MLQDEEAIKAALPREAQIIVCSTRDPSTRSGITGRSPRNFYIPGMEVGEIAALMQMVLRRHETRYPDVQLPRISRGELEDITRAVNGHALNAIDGIPTV